jgi:hypothetical protein
MSIQSASLRLEPQARCTDGEGGRHTDEADVKYQDYLLSELLDKQLRRKISGMADQQSRGRQPQQSEYSLFGKECLVGAHLDTKQAPSVSTIPSSVFANRVVSKNRCAAVILFCTADGIPSPSSSAPLSSGFCWATAMTAANMSRVSCGTLIYISN